LWGPDAGQHARSAVGMAALPFNIPVEIEAEVEISP
jgi:enamine deaminase RidA (YjgF/YER057c/UK114 family)